MKRFLILGLVMVLGVAVAQLPAIGTSDSGGQNDDGQNSDSQQLLEFEVMSGLFGPFVGSTNAIRGVNGAGLPWQIASGKGSVQTDGRVDVEVRGLVLFNGAPVPANLRGTNPIANFRAIVSCLTVVNGAAATSNVVTGPFPANSAGDSNISATVDLPNPCIAPIVFVGPSGTAWFAVTGR